MTFNRSVSVGQYQIQYRLVGTTVPVNINCSTSYMVLKNGTEEKYK